MSIETLMAARQRLVYQGVTTLAAALADLRDDSPRVALTEQAFQQMRGDAIRSPLDAIEVLIAEAVDDGAQLPITNPEGYAAARWLASEMGDLPITVPRAFVLYLAHAWWKEGKFATFKAALNGFLALEVIG